MWGRAGSGGGLWFIVRCASVVNQNPSSILHIPGDKYGLT